jgi:hypothetical protein
LLALALAGCGSDDASEPAPDPLDIPEGCNPLAADWDCMLPYPSDHFRDLQTGTVELTPAAQLKTNDGAAFDMLPLHASDGFAIGAQILALFPGGVRGDDLVGYYDDDPIETLGDDSPTVIVNATTAEKVLHFAELDPRPETDDRRAIVIRPIVRLEPGERYIVAIRRLVDPSGAPIEPPEGFRRIRDGETSGDEVLGSVATRYAAAVFPTLEAAGVAREELQLAWDFTVRTEDNATSDMLAVQSDVIAKLADAPPAVSVIGVEDAPAPHVFRKIELSVKVPLYVDSIEPLARLNRDGSGKPVANGEADVPFTVWIPKSVGERPAGSPPARLLQFGHGFFGSRYEVDDYASQFGDQHGFVVVATDWWGMSSPDRTKVVETMLSDPKSTMIFTDRLHQGMANFIAVAAAAKGAVANLPELQVTAGPAYDPSTLYFYGISQGHILGGTYTALAPEVERAALSVGGANFSLIAFRAQPFTAFLILIGSILEDKLDQQKFGVMLQQSFDRVDPLTYAPHVLSDTFPGTPPERRILLQIGLGDPAVPNVAAHLHARALGIPELAPAPRVLPGIEAKDGPLDSALVEFDFGISPWPDRVAMPATEGNDVHEDVRRLTAAKEQIQRFFSPNGQVEATCDGVCDPE